MRLAANLKRRAEMMSIIGGGLAVRERLGVEFRFKAYAEAGLAARVGTICQSSRAIS
jgi:hypothetical protein